MGCWLQGEGMSSNSRIFAAELRKLPEILSWVRAQIEKTSLNSSEKIRVELAIEEATVNVISHATDNLELTLIYRHVPERQIEFDLCDFGPPFNPLIHPETEKETSLEEREVGGLGLTFMKKCMDALFYRRDDDQNILTLVKKISS